ncbi:MAG TPA: phytoene desaturase family protein [Ignavibacteria bacterium]|nr:phytoene desaturase family protein [Ignavibacteria bacterium]HMQ98349.1 phytoene desaturase family protein [Ignavibacteria bacterium]
MKTISIAVIGSGLGGLSAAIRLAHAGYDVTVYEKNPTPGGKARSITRNGFRFDTGPSLITMPFVINELFESVGENPAEWLTLNKLDNLCRYYYPDGTILNAYSDKEKFVTEIEANTTEKKEALYKYLEYCKTIYELTADIFLFKDLYSPKTYTNLKALKTLFKLPKIDSFRTMNEANRLFFKDEKIIQLFNRYATYNGSDPYKCPATLNIISHVEYTIGGYYASGGMFSLTDALYKLAIKKGVKFCFNSPVEKIITDGKNVKGILTGGKEILSDAVISNADVYSTYGKLLNDNKSSAAKKYNKLEPSSSALVFYWGVNLTSQKLDTHNILFSADYKKEFEELFDKKVYPTDPTIYIYVSSKFSPADAPPGKENWFVMINAPNSTSSNPQFMSPPYRVKEPVSRWGVSGFAGQLVPPQREGGLNEIKETILAKIKALTGYDIKDKIETESIMTPQDIEEETGSYSGSIYGISSNSRNAAFLRQPNGSKQYKGLYFTGGSAHPGGGIPLVILSGKLAAEKIISRK